MKLLVHNKKAKKFVTFLIALLFVLNSCVATVLAEDVMNVEIPDDEPATVQMTMAQMAQGPNALQCGTMTSTKGFIRKPVPEIASDEYYINFHYMYPTGAGMNGFALWGSYDGVEYDDIMLYQTGDVIDARVGNNVREYIDITLTPDVWHNILIHVKADNTVELYINGVQAKIGNAYTQPQLGTGKMTAIGYCGDLSTAQHNGMAYYDNFRIFTEDMICIFEDFNGEITGWTYYTTAFPADPPVNIDMPVLQSVELTSEREGLLVGNHIPLEIKGVLNDGTLAVLKTAESIVVESSDPDVVTIYRQDGVFYALATGSGTATITATLTVQGVQQQGFMDLMASDEPILYGMAIEADQTTLLEQDITGIYVKGLLTDDTAVDMKEGVVVESTNPSVVSVFSDEYGAFYATAISMGQADIIARMNINGKQKEARITVSVVGFDRIELSANTGLFIGDSSKITITAYLTDGSVLPATLLESVQCSSSDEQIAMVTLSNGIPIVSMTGPGTAQISVQATFRGTLKSAVISFTGVDFTNDKTRSTYYTDEKVAAARRNVEIYDWANSTKNAVVSKADTYVALGYEYLWNLVTPQSIPRSYGVNQTYGCLNCGNAIDAYGNYPYLADHVAHPWKLECPNCHMKFPTNDFGAYYESGKDEHGIFQPELADRSLLVNVSYPEKEENWGVDDGYGYVHTNGRKYTFIAYYNHWQLWHGGIITTALNNLRDAFIYTGDVKYARAGAILLDRVADVYPMMDIWPYKIADGFLNSNGNSNRGKVVGSIWETGLARDLVKDYDAFFPAMDDQEIISFLTAKSEQYDLGVLKKSAVGIRRNIEDGIVRQIYPAVKDSKIRGNNGMHQSTLAMAAVVMDTMPETKEWLDFNFQSGTASANVVTGGNILATFVNDIDRDGHGNEASPGYNSLWLGQYIEVAGILDGYDLYPAADLYDNPKFKKMFYSMISVMLTDRYSALIGDTGSTGNPSVFINKDQAILAFERYGDPLLAQIIYFLNGNQTDGIHGNIFSSDPDQVAEDIGNIIDTYGPLKLESDNVTGYGLAVMRDGDNISIDFGINYEFMMLPISSSSVEVKMFPNNRTAQLEALQEGEHATFLFDVAQTDFYEIDLKHLKAGSYGIYDVYLDGAFISQVNFYGSGMTIEKLTELVLEEGSHEISFVCVGKNELSTNYKMGVTKLLLLNEHSQYIRDITEYGDTQRAVWMYYGVNNGHGHADTLNIGINAFGLDLTPELGYPEFADSTPHRLEWVSNTISHNTVTVDQSIQDRKNKVEDPLHFDAGEMVQLIDVDAPKTYQSKNVDYRRTTAMIRVDGKNFYVVDFFRVQGGNDHHFSFHGAEGTVLTENLNLAPQVDANGNYIGTYAGVNTEWGIRPQWDSGNSGFHWLKNVRKDDSPGETFSVDWNVKDTWNALGKGTGALTDIHIRLTMLEQTDSVAITTGVPPRNKPGNPGELEYLIAHKTGNNLDSMFTSVIEPYQGQRLITDISKVDMTINGQTYVGNDARAVKVEFADGRTDYIVYSANNDLIYTVDGKVAFKGFFGVYSEREGIPFYSYVNEGEFIGNLIDSATPSYTGTVVDFTRQMSLENEITVRINGDFDPEELVGRFIYIQNDGIRNATYKIKGIKGQTEDTMTLDIGDITTIRRWVDNNDFSKGYVYDMAPGQSFVIPLSKEVLVPFSQVILTVDNKTLTRAQRANVSVSAFFATGAPVPMDQAVVEIISTEPKIIGVDNGILTAENPGTAKVYAKVKYQGVTVLSEQIDITVVVTAVSLQNAIDEFIQKNELTMPLIMQVNNSLRQAVHFMEQNDLTGAVHHLQNLLKHLNNEALTEHVSDQAKQMLNIDVNALIDYLTESN